MLIVIVQVVRFPLAKVSAPFLGLFSLFRELRCGVQFWLCSLLVLFTWVLTIWVWFVMLVVCLTVIMVLFPLNLSMMVIFFCLFKGCFALGV